MSRKDYKKFASLFKYYRARACDAGWANAGLDKYDIDDLIRDFMAILATENPRFNEQRFLDAVYKGD